MNSLNLEKIEEFILEIRNKKVILDSDIAVLYGVETKRINEAVKNNPDKFPPGYVLELTDDDWKGLKPKFSTSIKGGKVKLPKAFTEKGLYMLATILKSKTAAQTTIAIIETFAKIRELSRNIKSLAAMKDEAKKKNILKKSGEIISEIFEDNLDITDTETSLEVNFAVLKFKHLVKRKKEEG